jgi:ferredoxin
MSYRKTDRRAQRAYRGVRTGVLVLMLAASTILGVLHQTARGMRPVGVDALDPFGGVEAAITFILSGALLERIAWSSFILLGATVLVALVLRRAFCGQICAFGALQELAGRLGRALFGRRRPAVPVNVDRVARYLKYVVLAGVVAGSAATASLFIRPYDPWAAWHHLVSAELISGFLVGLILLVVSLAGSLLYERFFCKYLCPMGAFLGLLNRFGWFRVKRAEATCTHCHACTRACPVGINVENVEQVRTAECITCNLCVETCPVADTLFTGGPRKGRLSSFAVLGISVGVFAAVLGASTAAGGFDWAVKGLAERAAATGQAPDVTRTSAQPESAAGGVQAAAAGNARAPSAHGGEVPSQAGDAAPPAAPTLDAQQIKGTDTFRQVSDVYGVPAQAMRERFGISDEEYERPIREAAHKPGSSFDVQAVRDFVAEQLGR